MWRLCLIQAAANALACGMGLLGIECPEKM